MNPTKYKITINTIGVSLEEIPEILEQIKESFIKGYVNGGAWRDDDDKKSYNFGATEV